MMMLLSRRKVMASNGDKDNERTMKKLNEEGAWIHIEYAREHRAAAAFIITMQASERWKSRRLQGIKMIKRPLSEHCTFVFQPSKHSCFFLIGHQHKKNIWSKSSLQLLFASFNISLRLNFSFGNAMWKRRINFQMWNVKDENSAAS